MEKILLGGLIFELLAIILLFWQLSKTQQRFSAALTGQSGDSLEKTLGSHLKRVDLVDADLKELHKAYEQLSTITSLSSQKISVVRFNPFGDTGGDQSFALAVLDGHNSGYVITSIHGREGTRVYVKPIDYGRSKYALSKEEEQAIDQATKRVPADG